MLIGVSIRCTTTYAVQTSRTDRRISVNRRLLDLKGESIILLLSEDELICPHITLLSQTYIEGELHVR